MNRDEVMRGGYRCRGKITSLHEILTEQQIALTTLIRFTDSWKKRLSAGTQTMEQVYSPNENDKKFNKMWYSLVQIISIPLNIVLNHSHMNE